MTDHDTVLKRIEEEIDLGDDWILSEGKDVPAKTIEVIHGDVGDEDALIEILVDEIGSDLRLYHQDIPIRGDMLDGVPGNIGPVILEGEDLIINAVGVLTDMDRIDDIVSRAMDTEEPRGTVILDELLD